MCLDSQEHPVTKRKPLVAWIRTGMHGSDNTGTDIHTLLHTGWKQHDTVVLHSNKCMHAGRNDRRPAGKPSLIKLGPQQQHQQTFTKAKAAPFRAKCLPRQHMQTAGPEYPPGFHPAVRMHSMQEFPGLTKPNMTHPPAADASNSTPAVSQLSISDTAAESPETRSPPTLSSVTKQTLSPPPGLPNPARPGSAISAEAHATNPMPKAEDALESGLPALPVHTPVTDLTAAEDPQIACQELSNSPGSSSQTSGLKHPPEQQTWEHHSPRLHQSPPHQSGWDCDSDSEPGPAWISGSNQRRQDIQRQQDSQASSPHKGGWRPDQYQGAADKLTGLHGPYTLYKTQQHDLPSTRQYSPGSFGMSPARNNKCGTERPPKAPTRVGGWNPDKYQGTAAAAYSANGGNTEENQRRQHNALHDASLRSLLPYAFPQVSKAYNTSEASRQSAPLAAAEHPDTDPSNCQNFYSPPANSASGRQEPDLGSHPANYDRDQPLLPAQEVFQTQLHRQQNLVDSSHNRTLPSAFVGGFGLRPSNWPGSPQGSPAQSPSHHCHSGSDADSDNSSSAHDASCCTEDQAPEAHGNQHQQPAFSAYNDPNVHDNQAALITQQTQDSDEVEADDPGHTPQPRKEPHAPPVSTAATGAKFVLQQHPQAGNPAVGGNILSQTGKVINPNEVSIRLNPSSPFYDAQLAICWRVLTRQDKYNWQTRLAKGQRMKVASLSKPRQQLAWRLHPGHPQYHAATAAAWKHKDAAVKEALLRSADDTGEAIKLFPDKPRPTPAEPVFHEADFPALGQPTTDTWRGGGLHKAATLGSSLQTAGDLPPATGIFCD